MTCQEITKFIENVSTNIGLIRESGKRIAEAHSFMLEIINKADQMAEHLMPDNLGIRIELSKKLDLSFIGDFHDGWALATHKSDNKDCYVNRVGEFLRDEAGQVYEFEHGMADRFSNGIAVGLKSNRAFFIKTDGSQIPPGRFTTKQDLTDKPQDYRFLGGFIKCIESGTHFGRQSFINIQGEIQTQLKDKVGIQRFTADGLAKFDRRTTIGGQGFFEKHGNVLQVEGTNSVFSEVTEFSEGYAWIKQDNHSDWQLIDTSGHYVPYIETLSGESSTIKVFENDIPGDFHNGLARIIRPGKAVWFLYIENRCLRSEFCPPMEHFSNFDVAADFQEGLAIVRENSGEGFRIMNTEGKYLRDKSGQIIELFDVDSEDVNKTKAGFCDGLLKCRFTIGSDWVYINKLGQIVKFGNK